MNPVPLASDPEDAVAVEAVEAHHAHLAGELAGRVAKLLDAVGRERVPGSAGAAEDSRADLVAFCDRELLPHAAAEESALYPAAHALPEARLLVDGMLAEHRRITALAAALRAAPSAVRAAADARALQVLFDEHLSKENTLILPLLAAAPGVSLAGMLAGMHDLLGAEEGGPQAAAPGGCGGTCGCSGSEDTDVPELDVRDVPHALRHATVFGALDAVSPGRAMVLVAPHDPLPLLAQIEGRNSGAFTVEYLTRGPEAWRILLAHR